MSESKILSIQSHVVSGYVGNRSSVLPMQILGNDVDFINTVQFSNHTGYKNIRGQVLKASDLRELYEGLVENGLANYTHIMSGYIGAVSFLEEVVHIVRTQKEKNPSLIYLCDPVMGDAGELYTPPELLPVYKQHVLPLCDVIIPNQFEAELLTDIKINNEEDVFRAIDCLHDHGIQIVIISSTSSDHHSKYLFAYASKKSASSNWERYRLRIPRLPIEFVGTGDLFAGLFMAWMRASPDNLKVICSKVVGTMSAILKRTWHQQQLSGTDSTVDQNAAMARKELKIVQSISDILNPPEFEDIDSL